MKQIVQSLKNGEISLYEVPVPICKDGEVLIKTKNSLISSGTERMLLEFGKGGLIKKARSQPERVRQALDKVKTDGVIPTLNSIRSKLDTPLSLGYCNVGEVVESRIDDFSVGDRVISNGYHAEFVTSKKNLCAKVPKNVADEEACFTVMGAISLQGIRLASPLIGESVGVIGLGILGLLAVQILKAHGCNVIAIDPDKKRLDLAKKLGADIVNANDSNAVLARSDQFSKGVGLDVVLITASTSSNSPIKNAAKIARKRGRIVLIGVTGLELDRNEFYEKELTFQVSCSYGPGRYDPNYEELGQDYPAAYVRWTEKRNFEAILDLMASDKLSASKLISHRFQFQEAKNALNLLSSNTASLGILLSYKGKTRQENSIKLPNHIPRNIKKVPNIIFAGAGNYARQTLMPAIKKTNANLYSIVSSNGVEATHLAKKFGFEKVSTDIQRSFKDKQTDGVVIVTRHNSHAKQILLALEANKHVFCEKPLCLTHDELKKIKLLSERKKDIHLMVGYNRRYAPQVIKMKQLVDELKSPKNIIITVNAGAIDKDHWTRNKNIGGGRVIGEVCHFVDLVRFLAGSQIIDHCTFNSKTSEASPDFNTHSLLKFENGSVASIIYAINGNRSFPKETVEIFCEGKVLKLDNFRKLRGWGWRNFVSLNLWKQNKGQVECIKAFINEIQESRDLVIPKKEIFEVAQVTLEIAETLKG